MYKLKIYWEGYTSRLINAENAGDVINILGVVCNVHTNVKGLGVQLFDSNANLMYDGALNAFVVIGMKVKLFDFKAFSENPKQFGGAFCASEKIIEKAKVGDESVCKTLADADE